MEMEGRTHLVLLIDRSGSMSGTASDASGAINEFLRTQANVPGKCWLTMVQFDHQAIETLHDGVRLDTVPTNYRLVARGNTPLLDAMGQTIVKVEEHLATKNKPRHVIFVTMTDGLENWSSEWTYERLADKVGKMIGRGWDFVYLGAALDDFGKAAHFTQSSTTGTPKGSTLAHAQSGVGYSTAFAVTDAAVTRSRLTGQSVDYTDEEREQVEQAT